MANRKSAARQLEALADPTRRAIAEQLARAPRSVGELADDLPVTRSAVSQHLAVLKDAGLVTVTAVGTRRIYRLDPRGIGAMRDWLDGLWGSALESFRRFADAEESDE
jgi:DNA-binding transcriptional ArsR family regulator